MTMITLKVNGETVSGDVPDRTHLADFIRDSAGLTGTHLGCEHGVCGACTLLMDGEPVRSCITFAAACNGHNITTVEGYDNDPVMARLRQAFHEHHALQCGYCTPGMLASARDIVLRLPDADNARIRVELSGNLCRCTGYQGIVNAIADVLQQYREAPDEAVQAMRSAIASGVSNKTDEQNTDQAAAVVAVGAAGTAMPAFTTSTEQPTASSAQVTNNGQKDNRIDDSFELPYPADKVWAFMQDLPSVANCLPGASIDSHDNDRVTGRITVRFGPMSAAFAGGARLVRDDAQKRAVFSGAGQDSLSQSRTNADINYQVVPIDAESSRVDVGIEYALQGPLAQFSRSGLVRDFVRRMIRDFAGNLEKSLGGEAVSQSPAPVNAGASLLQVLLGRLVGLFRR
jgi:carbon-monoxide dehydrogenase small subunit